MKKKITTFILTNILFTTALFAQDTDYSMIGITAGKVGAFTPDKRSDRYGIEYRAKPFSKWKFLEYRRIKVHLF